MELFGLTIARTKSLVSSLAASGASTSPPAGATPVGYSGLGWMGSWWPVIRESFTGAWQQNVALRPDTVLSYFAVYACVTLIAADVGKLDLRLVQEDNDGIWNETSNPAFSPVLRKPNHYQTISKFIEQWIVSKLIWGNAYVLKERDKRGVVVAMYVLNPQRVKVLVTPDDGAVYYELSLDPLSGLYEPIVVPASEIIHDQMVALYHPLVGVSPIYACGLAAAQGLKIQGNSTTFFTNGSQPGGLLVAPGAISDDTAKRLRDYWLENYAGAANVGKVAVLGDGLKYEQLAMSAVDAQLIDQLKWTAENVCACYHVAPYMIGIGPAPAYANVEPLVQLYYSQCLQTQLNGVEDSLDDGLGLLDPINGVQYGTEFDIDDLIWMDTKTRSEAAAKASGTLAPNESRAKYFGMGPTKGGGSPMVQQQYYSLEALAKRDAADPFAKPTPATPPPTPTPPPTRAAAPDLDIAELRRRVDRRVRTLHAA